ncbi:MAG: tRNA preQ1(34) S-adenosylmethionine ribosyltransferase-isomerase QueA [candidate division Zixibacteria bacterium]|nr:tRNA preQ1(34) S-adenosylmethionine ribosyltransferase-isomerase QueA [candidate division Zixibacteria bacterium]
MAAHPTRVRRRCRLLRLDRKTGAVTHHLFDELPHLLNRGDLLVANDSAVIPARLLGERSPGGEEAEIFLLEKLGPRRWRAMVRPGRRLRPGAAVTFGHQSQFTAHIESSAAGGTRIVAFIGTGRFNEWLDRFGKIPLPPYIERDTTAADRRDYQTVFARHPGAVAAPTAGLHFDPVLIRQLRDSGIPLATMTLHVGAGTFRPIRTEDVEDHQLDSEWYRLPPRTHRQITTTHSHGKRVIAVGTTVTRALESIAQINPRAFSADPSRAKSPMPMFDGKTTLLIQPGHEFHAIDGLVTNFHLPRSSLLALVAAFAGLDNVMSAYHEAIKEGYRFYSYGDAMLIL